MDDNKIENLLEKGVSKRVFSGGGAAVFCKKRTEELQQKVYRGLTKYEGNELVEKDVFFDLASLTKPLVTSLLLYMLVEDGSLKFEDKYSDLVDYNIPEDKRKITISQLLSHSSGLSSYEYYYKDFSPVYKKENKNIIIEKILKSPLSYQTGTTCKYSDFGFILLGDLIEKIKGKPLDMFFKEMVTDVLGISDDMFFIPLDNSNKSRQKNKKYACTEKCQWRNKVIKGEVGDEHCFLMGGVAGHAGLFANLEAVFTLCRAIFDKWLYGLGGLPISEKTLKFGLKRFYKNKSWGLGFDSPSSEYSSGGKKISTKSMGHLGFTGTSFWLDPVNECFIILLTNRVHPDRNNTKIREFRPWFHDKVMDIIFN